MTTIQALNICLCVITGATGATACTNETFKSNLKISSVDAIALYTFLFYKRSQVKLYSNLNQLISQLVSNAVLGNLLRRLKWNYSALI